MLARQDEERQERDPDVGERDDGVEPGEFAAFQRHRHEECIYSVKAVAAEKLAVREDSETEINEESGVVRYLT